MRKIFISLTLSLAICAMNCAVLDPAGLSDSYKGSEAKQKIKDAALGADLILYSLVFPGAEAQLAILDGVFTEMFVKIDDSKYYAKDDVDSCAEDVQKFAILLISDASTTVLLSSNCSGLKPNGTIL